MVTLADVARRAGVSVATASRVINDTPYTIAPELRERVLAAVRELRYVPNAHARALARSSSGVIGVIVHDVSDPYFAEVTRGLQRVATAHGRLVTICNSYRVPRRELDYLRLLRAQRVDGLVYTGSGYLDETFNRALEEHLRALVDDGARVVLLARHELAEPDAVDALLPDNVGGSKALGAFLAEAGHREVGVIAGPPELSTTVDRLRGLRDGLATGGVALPDSRVVHGDFTRGAGADGVRALLRDGAPLSAVVALNDAMAVGALRELRRAGLRVPDDLSLTGFGDMPIARDVTPALTTVRLPLDDMGARAMALLREERPAATDGRPRPARREAVPATLVVRDSVRRLR